MKKEQSLLEAFAEKRKNLITRLCMKMVYDNKAKG